MNAFVHDYGSMFVPIAIGLLVLVIIIRIVIAIERAIMRLALAVIALIVLVSLLGGGAGAFGRINTLQGVANAAGQGIANAAGQGNTAGTVPVNVLQQRVVNQATQALRTQGLNPAFLRVNVTCAAGHPRVALRYADSRFMFGMFSTHDFDVTMPDAVRC